MGTDRPKLSICSGGKEAAISGVQIGPGATALTLIPRSIKLRERDLVKETMAPYLLKHVYFRNMTSYRRARNNGRVPLNEAL
jgi:hypothetical protein